MFYFGVDVTLDHALAFRNLDNDLGSLQSHVLSTTTIRLRVAYRFVCVCSLTMETQSKGVDSLSERTRIQLSHCDPNKQKAHEQF